MAFTHVNFDDSQKYGAKLRGMLNKLESALEDHIDTQDVMLTMIDGGDATNVANFTELTARFGFANNADAKAAYDLINTALLGGAQRAAMNSMISKLR